VAGHSLGEYSALVAAGALTLADALPLVRLSRPGHAAGGAGGAGRHGRHPGPWTLPRCVEAVPQAAAASGEVVSAANFNDPKQTVIAGSQAGVDQGLRVLKAAGRQARAAAGGLGTVPLRADEAGGRGLRERLVGVALQAPRIPVVNNIDVAAPRPTPTTSAMRCTARPSGPVRWVEVVQALRAARRHPHHRVRPGQGAGRHGQAHRRRPGPAVPMLRPGQLAEARGLLA
jgi:[acyl-carrier-protein] S-malonyltransferase